MQGQNIRQKVQIVISGAFNNKSVHFVRLLFVGNNKVQRWLAPVTNTDTKFNENWWQKKFVVAHRWRVDRISLHYSLMEEIQTIIQVYNYWYLKPLQKQEFLCCCPLF
jgi:hypothetical protein